MKNKRFDEIYDIYAVRVIVQSVIECYNVLGVIHDMFRPIPYRFKDYIATPKPNRYQSLHTIPRSTALRLTGSTRRAYPATYPARSASTG